MGRCEAVVAGGGGDTSSNQSLFQVTLAQTKGLFSEQNISQGSSC